MSADQLCDALSLRTARPEDEGFLREVYASTRQEELALVNWTAAEKAAFVEMQFRAQDQFYRSQFQAAALQVIECAGAPIGRLYVDRREDEIRVLDIALLPENRGQGIGRYLMRQILAEADGTGRVVRIHVERHNPALHLYERLGFRTTADEGVYLLMEWAPSASRIERKQPSPVAHP